MDGVQVRLPLLSCYNIVAARRWRTNPAGCKAVGGAGAPTAARLNACAGPVGATGFCLKQVPFSSNWGMLAIDHSGLAGYSGAQGCIQGGGMAAGHVIPQLCGIYQN